MASAYGGSSSKGNWSTVLTPGHALDTVKKPHVIVRLALMVCCIVAFGTLADKGKVFGQCVVGSNGFCSWAIFVGVMGFLKTLFYLTSDFLFEMTNNVNIRRYITLADVISSFVWAFLFLVAFGVSVHNYNNVKSALSSSTKSTVQGSIAFMFICMGGFIAVGVLALLRYRQGVGDGFGTSGGASGGGGESAEPETTPYQAPEVPATE
ncbi:synaptogyrin-1-like [Oscarella lobularis]|uniref:synaptogyrin-1-like n=1 Tax=Oscarella lobularis TaxID=121494 RepID=UPI0033131850